MNLKHGLIGALVLAVLGWLLASSLWRSESAHEVAAPSNAERDVGSSPERPELAPANESDPTPAREEVAEVERSAPTEKPTRPTVFLVGDLTTAAGVPLSHATILVRAAPPGTKWERGGGAPVSVTSELRGQSRGYSNAISAFPDEHGQYRADISRLFPLDPHATPKVLWVKTMRPGASPEDFDVPLWPWLPLEQFASPLEIRANLTLARACEVRWRVRARDRQSVAISSAVLELHEGRPLRSSSSDASIGTSGADFGYSSELACGVEHLLVVHAPGLRPIAHRFVAYDGLDLGEFVLERGEEITGRISWKGEALQGVVRAELRDADGRESKEVEVVLGNNAFSWHDGLLASTRATATTGEDGSFCIEGLASRSYRLWFGSAGGAWGTPVEVAQVLAPASGLTIELDAARVELRVTRDGAPAPDVTLHVHERTPQGASGGSLRTDASGTARIWMHAGRRTSVTVEWSSEEGAPRMRRQIELDFPGAGRSVTLPIRL